MDRLTDYLLGNIENILLNGTQLVLNQVFKLVGFDAINDDILKHLVTSRLCQPSSKAGTVDYLKSYFDEDVELHKIGEVAASQRFGRGSNFQIRTAVSAGLMPLSCQTARYVPYIAVIQYFMLLFF